MKFPQKPRQTSKPVEAGTVQIEPATPGDKRDDLPLELIHAHNPRRPLEPGSLEMSEQGMHGGGGGALRPANSIAHPDHATSHIPALQGNLM